MLLGCCCIYLYPRVPCRHALMSQRRHFFGKRGRHWEDGVCRMGLGLSALLRLFFFYCYYVMGLLYVFIIIMYSMFLRLLCLPFYGYLVVVRLMYVVFIRRHHFRCKLAKKTMLGCKSLVLFQRLMFLCLVVGGKKKGTNYVKLLCSLRVRAKS